MSVLRAATVGANKDISPAFDPFLLIDEAPPANPLVSSVSQSGWIFGGFAGGQKQWGNWVLGIEADFDAADIKGNTSVTTSFTEPGCVGFCTVNKTVSVDANIDELGSVRGKVGWAFWQNWMIYGTGGVAFAHVKNDASGLISLVSNAGGAPITEFSFSQSSGTTMFGWAAGAGLDWKWQIDPGSAWVLGIEYLHYQFPEHTIAMGDQFGSGLIFGFNQSSLSVDTIKGRISYLFSIH